jgi:hypothetical protein
MMRWGLLISIVAACSNEPGAGDTGLPKGELLATLSLDDWKVVCKVIDTANHQTPENVCHQQAYVATRTPAQSNGTEADVRATCQATYDECLRDARPARPSTCTMTPVGADCGATVGEAEQCLGAIIDRRRSDAEQVPTCDTLTVDQANLAGTVAPLGDDEIRAFPACAVVDQKCPDFLR